MAVLPAMVGVDSVVAHAAAALLVVTFLAGLTPALQATRVDPATVLRAE